jgi:predicted methyltransferase
VAGPGMPPHRRQDYAALVHRALKPGGSYGLVCFRPEGGSGYTDQQVYERGSLGGMLTPDPTATM